MDSACTNTDREIWRETPGDYYSDSIHVTERGGIGINCGGHVIVAPVRKWHECLAALEEKDRRIEDLEHDFDNWQDAFKQMDDKLKNKEEQISALTAELEKAKAMRAKENESWSKNFWGLDKNYDELQKENDTLTTRIKELETLIDGAMAVVELFGETDAQIYWREMWLKKARKEVAEGGVEMPTQKEMVKEALQAIAQRKPGRSKLVYDKATKTIVAVTRRCDNDIGDGTICNAELVDGGEGFGIFCPLCELRDTIQEQHQENAALRTVLIEKDKEVAILKETNRVDGLILIAKSKELEEELKEARKVSNG